MTNLMGWAKKKMRSIWWGIEKLFKYSLLFVTFATNTNLVQTKERGKKVREMICGPSDLHDLMNESFGAFISFGQFKNINMINKN